MARILIIRFSALGDVAMTVPVIHSLAVQYPQHEITVLSRSVWQPLFQELPENVSFVGADLTGKHKGFWGLNSLYSELKAMQFDYVADFHHVLRSRYLCLRFWLANVPVASICKGRAGKQKLVRRHHKVMENQKSSFRRYADVLEKLGLTRAPVDAHQKQAFDVVSPRLACVKPVASVHPEPGSNSPL